MIPYNYQYILIISCIISGAAGLYAIFKRKMPGSKIGGTLILHGTLWTFMYLLQNYSIHINDMIFFYKLQQLFGYLMPTFFAIYIVQYFELKWSLKYFKYFHMGITLLPSIVGLQILLGDPFKLVWSQLFVLKYNQIYAYNGIFSQFIIAYNYLIMGILLLYFSFTLVKPQQILKLRTLAFLIAVIIYAIGCSFDIFRLTPYYLLFAPFIFNLLSSSIMLMSPEKMYKRDVLPVVYNVVIEKMTNPVIVTDSKNKIMYLNEAAKKILKIDKIRFLQQDIRDLFKSLFDYSIKEIEENEYFEYMDNIYQVGVYTVEDWQQVNRSMIFVLDDVTDLVKYSQDLEDIVEEKTQTLRESERLADIGKMTSMVGHDLRNPLQVIRLIGKRLENDLVEDQRYSEMIKKVNKNILYMDKIVSDLQLLAKHRTPNLAEICVCKLVKDALENMDVPNIVELDCIVSLERVIFVDVNMFERVLVNLFNNAVQAMPDGGKIQVDCVEDDGFNVVIVSDSGEGISKENIGNLFKPFFTTKAKGMGLGLSVCKHVVEYHCGEIWAESWEGKGTVFYIKIPSRERVNANTLLEVGMIDNNTPLVES